MPIVVLRTYRAAPSSPDDSDEEPNLNLVNAVSRSRTITIRRGRRKKKKQRFDVEKDQFVEMAPRVGGGQFTDTPLVDLPHDLDDTPFQSLPSTDYSDFAAEGDSGEEEDILPNFGPQLSLDDDDDINPENVVDLASLGLGDGRDKVSDLYANHLKSILILHQENDNGRMVDVARQCTG